jgi:formylmethanofuran dehydrogenase subunit E
VVKKDLSKLEHKLDSVENKFAKGFKSTTEKNNEDRKLLKELLEENNKMIKEVEENFQHQKGKIKKKEEILKCDECGETFSGKIYLRNHIKTFIRRALVVTLVI